MNEVNSPQKKQGTQRKKGERKQEKGKRVTSRSRHLVVISFVFCRTRIFLIMNYKLRIRNWELGRREFLSEARDFRRY